MTIPIEINKNFNAARYNNDIVWVVYTTTEIKEKDWCYDKVNQHLFRCDSLIQEKGQILCDDLAMAFDIESCVKVIACSIKLDGCLYFNNAEEKKYYSKENVMSLFKLFTSKAPKEYIEKEFNKFLDSIPTEQLYTKQDMIDAAKYGYEFRHTTQFPNDPFDKACINNFQQHLLNKQTVNIIC